jgi:hypothetical protein
VKRLTVREGTGTCAVAHPTHIAGPDGRRPIARLTRLHDRVSQMQMMMMMMLTIMMMTMMMTTMMDKGTTMNRRTTCCTGVCTELNAYTNGTVFTLVDDSKHISDTEKDASNRLHGMIVSKTQIQFSIFVMMIIFLHNN